MILFDVIPNEGFDSIYLIKKQQLNLKQKSVKDTVYV